MKKLPHKVQGFVLLVVLGMLALMSALALAFVAMAKLERQVARNYVDRMHAIMAAESGVEYAIARLTDTNTSWQEIQSAMQFNPEEYYDAANPATFPDASLEKARYPSFAVDADGDGALDPVSGVIGGTHAP